MKLLGLRLCDHDSNISYFDGTKLHYYKSERRYQIKHHAMDDLLAWKNVIKSVWGVEASEIDEIAIVVDPQRYKLPKHGSQFYPSIPFPNLEVDCPVHRVNHHYAHTLGCFVTTDKQPVVQIAMDGYGDDTTCWTVFDNNGIVETGHRKFNGSIGMLLDNASKRLGVKVSHRCDYAGKLMGLQSYGNFRQDIADDLNQFDIRSCKDIFDYTRWYGNNKLDWIRTVHEVVGDKLVDFFSEFAKEDDVIFYSGGVAQNVIWNSKLKKKFKNLVIPPHCSDEGLSLGAIEFLRIKNGLPKFEIDNFPFSQSDETVEEPSDETIAYAAKALAEGKVISWYQGHGEIGPRALGNRSILMDPRIPDGRDRMNSMKNREKYRPFGASVLEEYKDEFFEDLPLNPYMLYVGYPKIDMPAITHIDNTCRAQTVNESNGAFYKLLKEFHRLTGCAVLLNTSLNLAGKPIVANVSDAIKFDRFDLIIIGDSIKES